MDLSSVADVAIIILTGFILTLYFGGFCDEDD